MRRKVRKVVPVGIGTYRPPNYGFYGGFKVVQLKAKGIKNTNKKD